MKFSCPKQDLAQALQTVGRSVSSKPQMPILSGIYMKAEGDFIELEATDYELGIIAKVASDVTEDGEVVISGKTLQEVVRNLPKEDVVFEYSPSENIVKIKSGGANFTLLAMRSEDFPRIIRTEGETVLTLKDTLLKSLIKKTSFACAGQDARPIFTGCLMELEGADIRMVATNTHRLAMECGTLEKEQGEKRRYIVPKRVLEELLHSFSSEVSEDVVVSCGRSEMSFSFRNLYIISRLIEGQFPDYNRAIPKDFATHVTVSTADFLAAVSRVSLIARSADYNIIRLDFSGEGIHISSNNPEIGRAEESVTAEKEGPDVVISFNASYITDVLKNISGEKFRISLGDSLHTALVREEGSDSFLYVVTPVRTTEAELGRKG